MKVTKLFKMRHKLTGLYLGQDSLTRNGKFFKILPSYFNQEYVHVRIPTFQVKKFPALEEFRVNPYLFKIPHRDWVLEIYEPVLIEER